MDRAYIAIDLKSFYASVECVERGLDPLDTNLLVADVSRTVKTICLAVSPSLKACGISGRARLFEAVQKVEETNAARKARAPKHTFTGESYIASRLSANPSLSLSYIAAPPRMSLYMEYSRRIYGIYLRYVAPEDIHVYSVDEVFIDVTEYLDTYHATPRELAVKMIRDVLRETGITATAGIGTNLYLCKVAMDIVAKHMPPDKDGVRIGELDEISYRKLLWEHRPITDFWRVGEGIAKRLYDKNIFTMGDIAELSLRNEELLYRMFGVGAELIIDHAWGYEPCTMREIKNYRPETKSISQGQVLKTPYDYEKTSLIVREMADSLSFELVEKGLLTDQITLTVGYDTENLRNYEISSMYHGGITADRYGRKIPTHAHGTGNLEKYTSSARAVRAAAMEVLERVSDKGLLSRRITITANRLIGEGDDKAERFEQFDLFSDCMAQEMERERAERNERLEKNMQEAIIRMKRKYGKNAVMRGMSYTEGATAIERNGQIGGHRA